MSQDQDPFDATRRFEPVDPYNIPAEGGYQQGFEQQPFEEPQPQRPGFKQRLTRLGPLKLALLGTAGVIVLGGAAWGTTAAFQSSGSSSNTAAAAPATDQSQPGAGATTGGTGKHGKTGKTGKLARVTITQVGSGSFTGTEAKGTTVTVDYDGKTKFGSKAHALTAADLKVGMTVTVLGPLQGDTITATAIAVPAKTAKNPAAPTDPASPQGGAA